MNNAFYLTLKGSFHSLIYLNFCPDFFDHIGKRLNKKAKVNFKYYEFRLDNK